MHYDSSIVEEYYNEVTTINIRKNYKTFTRIIILYWSCQIFQHVLLESGSTVSILLRLLNLIFSLVCYFSTLYLCSYYLIERLNSAALLLFFISFLVESIHPIGLFASNFAPILSISLLMFSILSMNFHNAFTMWICSYMIFIVAICAALNFQKGFRNVIDVRCDSKMMKCWKIIPLYKTSVKSLFLFFIILGCGVSIVSVYLYLVNNVHKRYSFKRLGQDIQSRLQLKSAIKIQLRWLDTIMPKTIKDVYLEHSDEVKADKWIYIRTFDNVTILFADIVGFTKLGFNKTATKVLALLNDLFNRFDELCSLTNCEKLATHGDCYYCVAGCPNSRPDHAVSCTEMGLGMCRIIKKFNKDYNENVQIRVGIHTGRVNAAIIGKKRFRFDVYSNDVIIANTVELTGMPGRVHISESVYHFIRNTYVVERSKDLEVKREHDYGLAGMALKKTLLKTYFVDPHSSHIQITDERFQGNRNLKLITFSGKTISFLNDFKSGITSEENESELFGDTFVKTKVNEQRRFVEDLKFDPSQKMRLLTNPPLRPYLLTFKQKEVEWHFNIATLNWIDVEILSWQEISLLIDALVCFMYSLLIYACLFILFPSTNWNGKVAVLGNIIVSVLIITTNACHCLYFKAYQSKLPYDIIYELVSHPITRSLMCFYFLSFPLFTIICILHDCTRIYTDNYFTVKYFLLILFSLFITPLFLSAHYLVKTTICIVNVVVSLYVFASGPCTRKTFRYTVPYYTCLGQMNFTDVLFNKTVKINFFFQIFMVLVVIIVVIREIEINIRLMFYITRESKINYEEASKAISDAQELLYNIIPKYVFKQLKIQPGNEYEITNFNYAMTVPKAAVIFACISNFFAKYYREDYKSGENALKLLHKIICNFDDILKKDIYKCVDKIKTINDCYMVASGLNLKLVDQGNMKNGHLSSLMYYAFDILNALDSFNENFIFGTDKFELTIGYNFGPVTAGIIGSTKPMYDIWGDTVNISNKMYTTGYPGKIQVPDYVRRELSNEFMFTYRGKIFVKGKGEMDTYICRGPIKFHDKILSKVHIASRKSILNTTFLKNLYRRKRDGVSEKDLPKPSSKDVAIQKRKVQMDRLSYPVQRSDDENKIVENVFVGFTFD